jgi:hypothetical protein
MATTVRSGDVLAKAGHGPRAVTLAIIRDEESPSVPPATDGR